MRSIILKILQALYSKFLSVIHKHLNWWKSEEMQWTFLLYLDFNVSLCIFQQKSVKPNEHRFYKVICFLRNVPSSKFWFKCQICKLPLPVYRTHSGSASFWTLRSFCLLKCITIASFQSITEWSQEVFVWHPVCLASDISIVKYLIAKLLPIRILYIISGLWQQFYFKGK